MIKTLLNSPKINQSHQAQETFLGPWRTRTLESGLSIENHNGWPGSQKCLLLDYKLLPLISLNINEKNCYLQ